MPPVISFHRLYPTELSLLMWELIILRVFRHVVVSRLSFFFLDMSQLSNSSAPLVKMALADIPYLKSSYYKNQLFRIFRSFWLTQRTHSHCSEFWIEWVKQSELRRIQRAGFRLHLKVGGARSRRGRDMCALESFETAEGSSDCSCIRIPTMFEIKMTPTDAK